MTKAFLSLAILATLTGCGSLSNAYIGAVQVERLVERVIHYSNMYDQSQQITKETK